MKKIIQCCFCMGISIHEESEEFGKCTNCGEELWVGAVDGLKAISIKQPWAWLIVNGYKDLENRTTLKNFRGDVLIHAGKKEDDHFIENISDELYSILPDAILPAWAYGELKKGGIVGIATITDSITESDSPWFSGPNAFVIKHAKPLPFIKCKGQLGFFTPKID